MTGQHFETVLSALNFIEQYGASSTREIAKHLEQPLLKIRGELKNAAALGFVKETGYKWTLLEAPTGAEQFSENLKLLIETHPSKKPHKIARETGLSSRFLDHWLQSSDNRFFEQNRRQLWVRTTQPDDCLHENAPEFPFSESTDRQQNFIAAPLNSDLVVMAPPGTGKTHALVERLGWMSQRLPEPIDMASVCVLSFTNSAVNEITSRLKLLSQKVDVNDSVRYVTVRTFDSLSSRCLIESGQSLSQNFDKNIDAFTKLLEVNLDSKEPSLAGLSRLRWLFIDEVQDLSGARARMVYTLAKFLKKNSDIKFAFLGDRHQGIYNHSQDGEPPLSFLPLQQEILQGRTCLNFVFRKSYRYSDTDFSDFMGNARKVLDDKGAVKEHVEQLVTALPEMEISKLSQWLNDNGQQKVILAGRNITVAQIAFWLKSKGVKFSISEGSSSASLWPLWIWQLFRDWKQPEMSRPVFMKKANEIGDGDALYQALQSQGAADSQSVNVAILADQVFSHRWQGSSTDQGKNNLLTISTIHKAKGLQYDSVLVISDDCRFAKDDQARLLYVAMTRAKKSVYAISRDHLTERNRDSYFCKGMEHYYLDSLNNFQHQNINLLKRAYSLLSMSAGTNTAFFKIQQIKEANWLCILDGFEGCWIPVIRWYYRKGAKYPEDRFIPDSWTTVAWPDDDAIYKSIFGPQLLLPLPVFTCGN